MSKEIKEWIQACEACRDFEQTPCKEHLISHDIPERAWEKIGCDLLSCNGKDYLITVCYKSNVWEQDRLTDTKSKLPKLRKMQQKNGSLNKPFGNYIFQYHATSLGQSLMSHCQMQCIKQTFLFCLMTNSRMGKRFTNTLWQLLMLLDATKMQNHWPRKSLMKFRKPFKNIYINEGLWNDHNYCRLTLGSSLWDPLQRLWRITKLLFAAGALRYTETKRLWNDSTEPWLNACLGISTQLRWIWNKVVKDRLNGLKEFLPLFPL